MRTNHNSFQIAFEQQSKREVPINPKHLQLIESINKLPSENEKIIDLLISGLDLVNATFRTFTLTIYEEISRLFKEAHIIFEQISIQKHNEQTALLHLMLRDKFERISVKSQELEQLKLFLDTNNLIKMVSVTDDDVEQKVMELRFSHLNAEQLAILSDVVAFVLKEFDKQLERIPNGDRNSISLLIRNKQLKVIQQGIINSMQTRVKNAPEFTRLDLSSPNWQTSSNLNLTKDFLSLSPNMKDQTADKPVPVLPFTNTQHEFKCIQDYFLNYIFLFGSDKAKEWAEHYQGFILHQTYLEKLRMAMWVKFNPEENPYVGIMNDFFQYMWINYGKPAYETTQETVNTTINLVNDSRLVSEIKGTINAIKQNKNYQKIEAQIGDKYKELVSVCDVSNLFKTSSEQPNLKEDVTTELTMSFVEIEQTINWTEFEQEMKILSDQCKTMQLEFEKEKNQIESMCNNWFKLNSSLLEPEIVNVGSDKTTEDAFFEPRSVTLEKEESIHAQSIETSQPSQPEIEAPKTEIFVNNFVPAKKQAALKDQITKILSHDPSYKENMLGGINHNCPIYFEQLTEKLINSESHEEFIYHLKQSYSNDEISLKSLLKLKRLKLSHDDQSTDIKQLTALITNYETRDDKGFFRRRYGNSKTIDDLRILQEVAEDDNKQISSSDIEIILEFRDNRWAFFRKGTYKHNSLDVLFKQGNINNKSLSHTEEVIVNLKQAFLERPRIS